MKRPMLKHLLPFAAACTLCVGAAHAGKLSSLLGNDKLMEAGGQALKA